MADTTVGSSEIPYAESWRWTSSQKLFPVVLRRTRRGKIRLRLVRKEAPATVTECSFQEEVGASEGGEVGPLNRPCSICHKTGHNSRTCPVRVLCRSCRLEFLSAPPRDYKSTRHRISRHQHHARSGRASSSLTRTYRSADWRPGRGSSRSEGGSVIRRSRYASTGYASITPPGGRHEIMPSVRARTSGEARQVATAS